MSRKPIYRLLVLTLLVVLASSQASRAEKPFDFSAVLDPLDIPEDITLGQCSAVDIDSKGRMYVLHRGEHPVLVYDKNGKFTRYWGDDLISMPHGMRIDAKNNIWITDIGHHMVFKFNARGKLLLALGQTDKPGTGENQFDKPTDIAFATNGDVFVTDGYGNSRVMKFNAKGKFLTSWGKPGKTEGGAFDVPHAIVIDAKGRVLVGDRENDRIQIFDAEGKLLEIWPGFAPYGMELDHQGRLFVVDGRASKVLLLDSAGKVTASWGRKGDGPGEFYLPHMLTADPTGNLYIAEVGNKRLQMLVRQ